MTKIATPLLPTERIILGTSEQVQKTVNILVVTEMLVATFSFYTEKLGEIKSMVTILIVLQF